MTEFILPNFLEEETDEEIMDSMLSEVPDDIDKSEGSFIWDSLKPPSIEMAKAAEWAREILRRGFTMTTFGEYLEFKALEKGLERQQAVYATGKVTFKGKESIIIPRDTRVSTLADNVSAGIEFTTTEQVVIDSSGEAEVPIVATIAGESGNVFAGSISVILPGISGVSSVTNTIRTKGGLDQENDESLRSRIVAENQKDEGSGNIDDYKTWAKEISGVGNVVVEPLWNGSNTVRVIIFNRDGESASLALTEEVQNHLDPGQEGAGKGKAPIGAIVTVITVQTEIINVTIQNLQAVDGYTLEQAQADINQALKSFFQSLEAGATIRIRGVSAVIIQIPSVFDFKGITLNNGEDNIILPSTKTASLGSVSYS